jgi:hypothetical protein
MPPSAEQIDRVYKAICYQVSSVLGSQIFDDWRRKDKVPVGGLIVFNNSFLSRRERMGTSKSKDYLCVKLDPNAEPGVMRMDGRSSSTRINSTFKRVAQKKLGDCNIRDLRTAIADEMQSLGTIVFSLVGSIGDDERAGVELPTNTSLTGLRFEPGQQEVAAIEDSCVLVNRLDDLDVVWQAVEAILDEHGVGDKDKLAECFEARFSDLREEAGRPIDVEDIRDDASSILSEVVTGIGGQVAAYRTALATHLANPGDTEALNEVMRIAYNFADGARDLMALIVGLSDLKPLLGWLTISAQCELAERFANLPFSMVGKDKASLEKYRTLIAGARSRAFHDLFAFGRPFRVPLQPKAFEEAQLRLFREYKSRNSPALDYKDRELVGLLEGFTRASEQPVPLGFWDKNHGVMQAIEEVARALRQALVLVARE